MNDFPNPIIAGIPALFAIPLLVAGLKSLGMPVKYAPLASILLGVGWMLAAQVIAAWPNVAGWLTAFVIGPLVGLAATGGYSAVKSAVIIETKDLTN